MHPMGCQIDMFIRSEFSSQLSIYASCLPENKRWNLFSDNMRFKEITLSIFILRYFIYIAYRTLQVRVELAMLIFLFCLFVWKVVKLHVMEWCNQLIEICIGWPLICPFPLRVDALCPLTADRSHSSPNLIDISKTAQISGTQSNEIPSLYVSRAVILIMFWQTRHELHKNE